MSEASLLDLYRHDVDAPREEHYVHFVPGGRRALSTREFFTATACLAEGLAALGISRGDRVLLLSDNRPEWHMADLSILDLGAVDVPLYGTLTPSQIAYQANDSGAVAAIVDTPEQMAKLIQIRRSCPALRHLVQVDGAPGPGCTLLDEVIAQGTTAGAAERFWQRAARVRESDLATIVYTSGTTGEPKGVMLSHGNIVHNVVAAAPRVPVDHRDLALEFLPLCHVLERMLGYVYMWRATGRAYCSVHHVAELISQIRPTLFAGVPRFFEKVRARILEKAGGTGVGAALVEWAIGVGKQAVYRRLAGKPIEAGLGLRLQLADRLVLAKIRNAFGGRLRYAISGGAALPLHVNEFFHAVGIPILEGYGLTETSPVIAVNGAGRGMLRLGTVGKPLENLTLKLAPDGELLVKGPSVTAGYWNKPEQTAEAIDADRYLATGDIADLDDDGFLLITDRKKDLIVTGGGKNVAPQPIESELKRCPLVDQAVLVGDGRPAITALISPNLEELQRFARARGIAFTSASELTAHPDVVAAYESAVETVNAGLARYEQIKTFRVLPGPLSLEGGHLTPTLKVKRRVVEREQAGLIDEMYRGE